MTEEGIQRYRASVIHNLRSNGWSKQDAEDEADYRVERLRQKQKEQGDG